MENIFYLNGELFVPCNALSALTTENRGHQDKTTVVSRACVFPSILKPSHSLVAHRG